MKSKVSVETKKGKKRYQKPQLKKYKALKKAICSTSPIGIIQI